MSEIGKKHRKAKREGEKKTTLNSFNLNLFILFAVSSFVIYQGSIAFFTSRG